VWSAHFIKTEIVQHYSVYFCIKLSNQEKNCKHTYDAVCLLRVPLLQNVTSASSMSVFRKSLKTHLFSHSFSESPVVPVVHFGH